MSSIMMQITIAICLLLHAGSPSAAVLKWCVEEASYSKGMALKKDLAGSFAFVNGTSEADCYAKIANKEADLGVFDGGSINDAGKKHGLKVIMAERLNNTLKAGTAYYAVAVVKETRNILLSGIKGTRSCHTGVQKTSGWVVPVGTLLRKKYMSWVDCDQYASVAAFFGGSCAPGANDPKYNKNKAAGDKLCQLCDGTGINKCKRSSAEPYYGYSGAFKCLKDGKGDIAFIKASILMALSPADKAQYKLLCPDETTAVPNNFESCNLARVPSHGILARPDVNITFYQDVLATADKYNFRQTTPYGGGLFSRNTIALEKVATEKQAYDKYLDTAYMEDVKTLESCNSTRSKGSFIAASGSMSAMSLFFYAVLIWLQ